MNTTIFFCLLLSRACLSLTIGVVGAHGGLGRELVLQSLSRGHTPLAFTRRDDPVFPPTPYGWLSPTESDVERIPMNVTRFASLPTPLPRMDAVVFAMSGRPFSRDTSTEIVRDMCERLPDACKTIVLVSAWGVGDSIENSNSGIRVMRDFYLESTYSAKAIQESLVSSLGETRDVQILRPKVLSYDTVPLNTISTPRRALASEILSTIDGVGLTRKHRSTSSSPS